MSAEDARVLAKRIAAEFADQPMPVVATALAEILAIYAVLNADTYEDRSTLIAMTAAAALDFTEAIDMDVVAAGSAKRAEAEKKRVADLLASAGPKRASPWGEP